MTSGTPPAPQQPKWRDPDTLRTIVFVLVGAAAGWYLMLQLTPVFRPLLIAAFLAYVLMPYHSRLWKRASSHSTCCFCYSKAHECLTAFGRLTLRRRRKRFSTSLER